MPNTTLQAAWALRLMRELDTDDVLIGMVAANRVDFEHAIGKFTNLLPFRVRASGAVVPWLKAHQRHVLAVLEHESVPPHVWFSKLGLPVWQFPFEASFTYVNYGTSTTSARLPCGLEIVHSRQVDRGVPPAFGMVAIPGPTLRLRLEYNRACGFDHDRMERLYDGFVADLLAIVCAPEDASVEDLLDAQVGPRGMGVPLPLLR